MDDLDKVWQITDRETTVLLIKYGKKDGRDIDYFALKNLLSENPYNPSNIDVFEVNIGDFFEGLTFFNPLMTEPVLTGEVVWGSEELFEVSSVFLSNPISAERVLRLRREACKLLSWAIWFLNVYKTNPDDKHLLGILANLSYSESSRLFADYYESHAGSGAITLARLIEEGSCEDLLWLRGQIKGVEFKDLQKLEEMIEKAKLLLGMTEKI